MYPNELEERWQAGSTQYVNFNEPLKPVNEEEIIQSWVLAVKDLNLKIEVDISELMLPQLGLQVDLSRVESSHGHDLNRLRSRAKSTSSDLGRLESGLISEHTGPPNGMN
jgi:hypothetical protein